MSGKDGSDSNPWAGMNLGGMDFGMGGQADDDLMKVFSNFDFDAVEDMGEGDDEGEGDEGEGDYLFGEGDDEMVTLTEKQEMLLHAVSEENIDQAKEILASFDEEDRKAMQEPGGLFVAQLIAGEGPIEVIQTLIDMGMDINAPTSADGDTMAFQAFSSNTLEVAQFMIDSKAVLSNEEGSALHFAASNTAHDTLTLCLAQPGVNVNQRDADGQTALMVAAGLNTPEAVQKLIDAKAEINPDAGPSKLLDGQVPIHFAVQNPKYDTVTPLLQAKADALATFADGEPIILVAAQMSTPATMAVLLEAGAKWDAKNSYDDNILHHAARNLQNNTVETVLNLSAELMAAQDNNGDTPLITAAQIGNLAAVEHMIAAKADLEIRNKHNRTAIFEASRLGHLNIIKALADAGADVDILGDFEKSLALLRKLWHHDEIDVEEAVKIFQEAKNNKST